MSTRTKYHRNHQKKMKRSLGKTVKNTANREIIDTHVSITHEPGQDQTNEHPQIANITVEAIEQTRIEFGMSEYGYPMVTYRSALKNHSITLELDTANNEALINNLDIQYCTPNELTLLLKKVEHELKKININNVIQQVTFDDWNKFLKPHNIFELQYHNSENNVAAVKCPVDRCAEAIMKGLGFTKE